MITGTRATGLVQGEAIELRGCKAPGAENKDTVECDAAAGANRAEAIEPTLANNVD